MQLINIILLKGIQQNLNDKLLILKRFLPNSKIIEKIYRARDKYHLLNPSMSIYPVVRKILK